MHPKRPGDISQRFPRLSSRNRFALLMSVQLEGASHMDASGLCTNAPLASPHTNWLALEFREATNGKVACAKLYDRKTPITAADLLNDRVIPFFDSHDVKLLRVLTDRGSEYCGIRSGTSTSSISRSRTSITRAPKPRARRPTASASASTKPC
jgi:hypothetical protein